MQAIIGIMIYLVMTYVTITFLAVSVASVILWFIWETT